MEPKPNWRLIARTMTALRMNPDQHYQGSYRCRSGMCFAGWAVTLAGGQWVLPDLSDPEMDNSALSECLVLEPGDPERSIQTYYAEEENTFDLGAELQVVQAMDRAQRILGLDNEQTTLLFAPGNELEDIQSILCTMLYEANTERIEAEKVNLRG